MKPVTEKIKKLSEIEGVSKALKKEGKKVVLCHGVFDLLHAGHIRHLHAARREGDALIVSVTPDKYVNRGPDRPVFPQELRAEVLASLDAVDYAVMNTTATAVEVIRAVRPDFYVKGSDYKDRSKDVTGKIYEEEEVLAKMDGKMVFTEDITFSSSTLANNFFNRYSEEAQAYLKGFRQKLSGDALVAKINGVSPRKVLVLGDAIIDEYHYVTPLGKSPKENVIVTKYETEEIFAGGGLAAANHVASLCDEVDLVTCVGSDDSRESLFKSHLKKNVRQNLFQRNDAPTIVKRRFVEQNYNQKLFQICFINNTDLPEETERQILDHLNKTLPQFDLVLVTDFGHGLMTPKIIDLVCKKARFLAVNAQSNSANHGFNLITKYPRADFVCIDEPEIRLALHDRKSPLEPMIKRLSGQLDARSVIITHGNHGCIAFSKDEGIFKIPVFTRTVVDTIGAGDAFLSISAPCVASGFPIEECGFIGNAAGALKVGIVGNRSSIDKGPLLKYIATLLK